MSLRIEDYALIGDLHTAALVGRDGSIDWLCAPRFDSGACFAALLGDGDNGRWLLAPRGAEAAASRRYRDGSLILETRFETEGGAVTVIDFMPRRKSLERVDLIRMVRGERGTVPMHLDLALRFDYGRTVPWVRRREGGLFGIAGPDAVAVRSPVPLVNKEFRTTAQFEVAQGDMLSFSLTWHPSIRGEAAEPDALRALEDTEGWWQRWSKRLRYQGPWRDAVLRSLITLKALIYEPTGAIVAAPTTSLPEHPGGQRNWDYRYCWLRDATFTLYALLHGGYKAEARAWREWLLRAVAGRPEEIQIMYGVGGERRLPEQELSWLRGYAASQPVRIGNAAHSQVQLDIFGEIMDMFDASRAHGLADGDSWHLQKVLLDCLESRWDEPGAGIWEIRGEPRRFTHSKVMAWVAVDRCIKAVQQYGLDGPANRWRKLRATIHQDICNKGFSAARNSFVQYYGGEALDAALLMIPCVGFLPADDPRVVGTVEAIERELVSDGFVSRYSGGGVDGLPEGEGTFLACSFWRVDCLEMMGRRAEAEQLLARLVAVANDVGLLAEEYDPVARRQLGNFPQAFSHIALVNSALNLASARGPARQRAAPHEAEIEGASGVQAA
ncbi:MAG TPA: glycoside hydrolase family 15 protein [Burkholderiales bacterium]|nr:glycoside hydrolase family 15 protein [Burkholderiales bacterium]